jgi:DNA-binding transcriptional LysR family regulator
MKDLLEIAIFAKVAERKTFSAVAQELGLAPSAISRQISRLEHSLGLQLLLRSTRQLRLTDAGDLLYKKCVSGLRDIESARGLLIDFGREPQGWLRILSTPCFGKFHVVPAIPGFIAQFPKVNVDISLGYLNRSFIDSGFDILIRASSLVGAGVSIDILTPVHQIICAAPDYLQRCKAITSYRDLTDHNCLIVSQPNLKYEWRLSVNGRQRRVKIGGNYLADNVEALHCAAVAGLGVALLPNYVAAPALQSGALVALFPAAEEHRVRPAGPNTLKAFSYRTKQPNLKVDAFIRFLKARFSADYDWEAQAIGSNVPVSFRKTAHKN